jgi:tetratricopeptide (TPR) repeat protein
MVPVFAMSLAAGAVSIWTQGLQTLVANDPMPVRTWPERLAMAGDTVWFYLGKLIWPHPLVTIYPPLKVEVGPWGAYLPLLAVVAIMLVLWRNRTTWARPWFFGFAYFLVMLLPVLGLVDNFIFRYSLVFDHFQYLASMGPLALAGAVLVRSADRIVPGRAWLRMAFGGALLSILGALTWQRALVYESEETLWTDTLERTPDAWIAHANLGRVDAGKGRIDEAISRYRTALGLHENSPETHYNLGAALAQKGEADEAIVEYRKAIEIYPTFPEAHYALGGALAKVGRMNDAIVEFRKAVELTPGQANAHNDLGAALYQTGQWDEALVQFQEALRLDPTSEAAQANLAKVKAKLAQRTK